MAGLANLKATGVGGPGDLGKKVGKSVGKKIAIGAVGPALLIIGLASLLVIALIGMGGTSAYTSAKSSQVMRDAGVPDDQLSAYMYATQATGIPYQLMAALAQGETGAPPAAATPADTATGSGSAGPPSNPPTTTPTTTPTAAPTAPYGVFSIPDSGLKPLKLTAADAVNVSKSARAIAGFLQDRLRVGKYDKAGGLLVGASPSNKDGVLTMSINQADKKGVAAAKLQEDLVVAAMTKLLLTRHDEAFMRQVYEMARSWAFAVPASMSSCPTGGSAGAIGTYTGGGVAGLTPAMSANAWAILQTARRIGLGDQAAKIGLTAALAESSLQNYANDGTSTLRDAMLKRGLNDQERAVAKQSMAYPHDAVGNNLDSMGLFQQRPMTGWGTPAEIMVPATSAKKFFDALAKVSGWQSMSVGVAAQTVQGSPSSDGGIYTAKSQQADAILKGLAAQPGASVSVPAAPSAGQSSAAASATPTAASPATGSAAPSVPAPPPAQAAALPYTLPATHGYTGAEESINDAGQVPSGKGVGTVTFSKFAKLGAPYRDYYITMRWNYAAWNWNGTSAGIDQKQFEWMNSEPRLVLVTNPRTGKSIIAAALEAGPGPWVGAQSQSSGTDPSGIWKNPTRGTPVGYNGIVSGFPPAAIAALGAKTGYLGQQGDDLIYQWAPDQKATPGPTDKTAVAGAGGGAIGSATACSADAAAGGVAGSVVANGPSVTIPNNPNVPPAVRGKTIQAPTPEMAKGLAAGFNALGLPYVWGGGDSGGGPDNGCARAGGAKNSCGSVIGFDCSGLTAYVLKQGGAGVIPGNSGAQRASGTNVPTASGLPGDILGFPGHVALYLGVINGVPYELEAPDVGLQVRVRQLSRTDQDPMLHRYWKPSAGVPSNQTAAAPTNVTR
ncbi:MAG: C40 family peptidase [Nakamurella sp.]